MTQPLTPAQEAAAYYALQSAPPPAAVAAPAPTPMTASQVNSTPGLSFQQRQAFLKTATPDPVVPPPPMTPEQRIADDAKHGRISYQQELAAMRNPGAYTGPPGSQAAPAPAAGPAAAKNLTAAPAAPGAAEGQPEPPDPTAELLRPRAGATTGPHAVGYSQGDKAYLGTLDKAEGADQANTQATIDAVQQQAKASADSAAALATESQHGLLDFQKQQQENARQRQQIEGDAATSQRRIEAKMADLEATGTDPNRYYHNQSTGQNILGAVLVGLGGFGAHALGPGGHDSVNTALEITNNAIQREVDAQKTDMQKQLSILGQRMNLNAQGFDQQKAMLEAERESIQSTYALASNEVARRAAMFKDNADVQGNAAKFIAGLQASRDARIDEKNKEIYGVVKGAERVVPGAGAGTDLLAYVRKRTPEIIDKAHAEGHELTPTEAHRQAVDEFAAIDVSPGTPRPNLAAAPKGGGLASARVARMVGPHMNNAQKIDRLTDILNRGTLGVLGSQDLAEARQLRAQLEADGVKGLPEIGRFNVGRITGSQQAATKSAGAGERGAVKTYQGLIANGPGAPGADEVPDIEGVDKESE